MPHSGILFCSDQKTVNEAIAHLASNAVVHWTIGSTIRNLSIPATGYLYVTAGSGVIYECNVSDVIIDFTPVIYQDPRTKPVEWRARYEADRTSQPQGSTLVLTSITPSSIAITDLRTDSGGSVTPPSSFCYVHRV